MKASALLLGLAFASALQVPAQVVVEVTLEQDQFLPGEALPAAVRVVNRSGQTLRFGGEPDWLTLSVESRDGFIVAKNSEVPVLGEFTLESSKVATKHVDLAPYFTLTRPGRYSAAATVRIKEWNGQATSPPKGFDIITGTKLWSQEFGVPLAAGVSNRAPEVRKYTLQQANYLRSEIRLYLRLTDASESQVIKVFSIGPLVSFSQPQFQVDSFSKLHVLYQSGPRRFSYTVVNPDGDITLRQTYEIANSRPRLQLDQDGKLGVAGGVRRLSSEDVPAPRASADQPSPADHGP